MNVLRRLRSFPWLLRLLWLGLIAIPLGVAGLIVGVEISSQPSFCGSCHVMKPYYTSWETSSHNDVACVECHIPPGIGSEIRKKYEALSMVASYFTGTYGTNPWAEVPDESCLRPGCHEQRLLIGRELVRNVLFDHRPHLTELRREKRLRCTSCHSQIVQGKHIAVTESTCFLCHFKDVTLNEGTAQCTLCHETPETIITTAGLRFDHADVKRFDMECTLCHAEVVQGNGEVPRNRCLTCHSEPARLARYGETEFLHKMHVTEHKVECLSCHIDIQHRVPEQLEAVGTSCETCHVGGMHSPQRDLYVGIAGKAVQPRASAMYLAGVRCEGCHLVTREGRRLASEVSCMSCHGARFFEIYQIWQGTLAERTQRVREEHLNVKAWIAAEIEEAQSPSEKLERYDPALELLHRAEENIAFVERAHAVHNPGYALEILWQAHEDLQQALPAAGLAPTLEPPWLRLPYETRCTACHLDAVGITKEIQGRTFRHETHAVAGGVACSTCHQDLRYQDPEHGTRKLDCTGCHPAREQLAKATSQDCLRCHTAEVPVSSEIVKFPHDLHVSLGLPCAICHTNVDKYDHLDYLSYEGAVPALGHEFCGTCHGQNIPPAGAADYQGCLKCHTSF